MRINETAPPVQSGAAPAGQPGSGRPAGRSGVRHVPPRVGGLVAKVPPPWRLPLATYLVCQLILLFWWAAFYPGLMNADSINFVLHVTTGPWINNASVLYDFLVLVSLKLTGDLGLLTLAQTVATAAALAYTVYAFRRLGVPGKWTAIAAAIVVALPPQGSFIIFVWKDVPFTICAYLLVPTLAHLISLRDLPNWRRHRRVNRLLVAIGLELLGVCLFRQDGVVITGLTAVGLVILLAGVRGRIAALAAGAIFLTFLLNLVIFPAVGIRLPSRSLLFGPSNADIAVVYAEAPQTFTPADLKVMAKVVPLAEWKASGAYPNCYNSNYTTFLRNFDNNASRESTPLFKLWLRTLKRTPQLVIGARICRGSIAWLAFPGSSAAASYDYLSYYPANLWGWANVPAVKHNPYRRDFSARPLLGSFGNNTAIFLRVASETRQLDWLLWRGATWSYLSYAMVVAFALRRKNWALLSMVTIVAGQQLMVFADNPDQLFRYMMTAMFAGPMLIPLFLARNRPQPTLDSLEADAGAGTGAGNGTGTETGNGAGAGNGAGTARAAGTLDQAPAE
jgi:hypothetical protein